MVGKVYGIGVGPGDPKLLTVKAAEVIGSLDILFYPSFGKVNMALNIAKPYLNNRTKKVEMKVPLSPPKDKFKAYYEYSDKIMNYLNKDKNVGVLCEGEPLFFGSFINIWYNIRDEFKVEIIPGISSVMSAFSQIDEFMAMGDDSVSIITANMINKIIKEKISSSNTTIIIKIGNKFQKINKLVTSMGLSDHSIFLSNIHSEKQFTSKLSKIKNSPNDYFSIIIVKNSNVH
jgi:precorrin-2/cobalt-factor-2 C20-methyltransferase